MTTITSGTAPNGDHIEIRTNPGCAPLIFRNGVLQDEHDLMAAKGKLKKPALWEPWFAWHPVKIGDQRVWLKRIYRRVVPYGTYANIMSGSSSIEYEYGTIFDVIRGDQ